MIVLALLLAARLMRGDLLDFGRWRQRGQLEQLWRLWRLALEESLLGVADILVALDLNPLLEAFLAQRLRLAALTFGAACLDH